MKRLVIAGAGGLGREVAIYARQCQDFRIPVAFLDDTGARPNIRGLELPTPTPIDTWNPRTGDVVVVALGAPEDRISVISRLRDRGASFAPPMIHPLAWVAPDVRPGPGCIITPFTTIGTGAQLGAHVIVNTHAGIGHDARIGEVTTLAPHSVINGWASIGSGVLIGSGAVITPRCQVGDNSRVAAGSVVYTSVGTGLTASGNPARAMPVPAG